METLDLAAVRRLALARAGLMKPAWTGLPERAGGRGARARRAAHEIIRRFGYLQLDTVSVAGARSHSIVLHSRLEGLDAELGEELLRPGEPLFEYWGHEASWLPIELYPVFAFRRRAFRQHPWWGDLIGSHPGVARDLRRRIRTEGALRSVDLEGEGSRGWWDLKVAKKVAIALWSSGELAIRERRNFQRSYDLAERVIPAEQYRARPLSKSASLERLLLLALEGHGWAQTGTLARTWRLTNIGPEISAALARLRRAGKIVECGVHGSSRRASGWIRPEDLELAARLRAVRTRPDRGVLLSPFDPLLWDRARVQLLFGFDQVLEIFKPAPKRKYGYYCMPVLAGDRLVARFDLKSERKEGRLRIVSARLEDGATSADREAARSSLQRYAGAVGLEAPAWRG
ncbi:MAG: winged helix-turn-helix domain-containing protein [Candidatus Eiseniibacteriota bacterium]